MNAILYNGRIYPQYRVCRRPTVLVITASRIEMIGTDQLAIKRQFPGHTLIDLGGRVVIPGLVDSHTHFYFWAATLDTVHLDGISTYDKALKEIQAYGRKRDSEDWIIGDGWSADRWGEYHLPTAAELDAVTGGRPAALYSKDQHILWVNSRALQMAGIDRQYPDPEGGKIDREPVTGNPTGILRELPAYSSVLELMSRPGQGIIDRLWAQAARVAHSRGITGFHSVDSPEAWDYFRRAHRKGKLGFRVHYYFPAAKLDELIENKIKSGMGDDTLQVGGIKIFCDGSLGAQTALMKKPYLGRRNGVGVATIGMENLIDMVKKADGNNLACAIHAIGDQAVANAVAAYERTERKSCLRHRIEHLQLISRSDIPRLRKIGVIASMQPSHCPSDRDLVVDYWGGRGRNAYIFKTLLKHRIPLAFGSDCPIEPLDPLAGICAAVNRTGYGERGGRFYPEERLTVSQAVYGFTAGAAFAAGREDYSGKIAPGYQADLVILDDDIFSMPQSLIYKARIGATIFDGNVVYHNGSIAAFC